ncbi:MAG: hypothetical protein WCX31_01560 [Salinivirgaceae bacterium]|jgi:hypothetical protein
MAKKTKNTKQFQQALLSNTDFIQHTEATLNEPLIKEVSMVDDAIMEKFKLLATFEGVTEKELINQALNHYLRLKSLQLEQAMNNKK